MNCDDAATLGPQYLSGELDTRRTVEFEDHLRSCRRCSLELEQQTQMDVTLRDGVLSEAVDSTRVDRRVRQRIASERQIRSFRRPALVAGIAAVLLGGFTFYRGLFTPVTPSVCSAAAEDHRKEVTKGQHRNWLTDPKEIAGLAQRSGLPASVVITLAPAGFHLDRAKLCRLDGRVFMHLVYVEGANEFSAYLRPLDSPLPAEEARASAVGMLVQEADRGHQHIAYFQTSRLMAMFVSDQSSDAALAIGRSAARGL
jgi:anti-sigma factor RsiW